MTKEVKVVFAPGCFDNFDGSQEELQELIAAVHQMAENGTIFEHSEKLSTEEEEEFWKMMEDKQKEQRQ